LKPSLRALRLVLLLLPGMTASVFGLRPEVGYRAVPSDYGIVFEDITFETSDGLLLRGWFFPAQDTTGIASELVGRVIPVPDDLKPPSEQYIPGEYGPAPTIVICPGDAGNMTYSILYAYEFFTRGFNVFTFDWRGFGESDSWPMDPDRLVYSEFLADYEAALDYVLSRPDVDTSGVGLLGFSTGAYLSFAMAAERNDVAALAVRATITTFEDLSPILARLDPDRAWNFPQDYPEELLPANAAARVTIPVLLVVGEHDERTPPWMSREVYDSLPGPGELWVVPGAGHGGGEAPELVAYDEFFEKVRAFFKRRLKDSEGPGTPG